MKQIAYVGVAHIHTPGFVERINNRDDVQVKAVWDFQPERASITAERLTSGAQVVTDLADIWADDEIEAVVICSETNRHPELVFPAVEAGKHLFVEKPLGIHSDEAYKMARAINEAGVLFQTGYFKRSQAIHRFIKEQIEQGTLGQVTRIRHTFCHEGSLERWFDDGWFENGWLWMTDMEQAGVGAFGDLGTHSLDILMWLMGDVKDVTALVGQALANYPCDEFGEALMRFNNGAIGTLAASWVDVANPITAIVSGTEGHITVMDDKVYFRSKHIQGADGNFPWTNLPRELPHAFSLFLDALVGRDVPLVTANEAAARTAVMEAIYQSIQEEGWVQPNYISL